MSSKVLFSYQRLAYLFDTIKNETLPQQELANRFSVSTRTIRTDISALNDILRHYGAQIDYTKNIGYQLLISDAKRYAALTNSHSIENIPRTSKERIVALIIAFLTQSNSVKLDDIADKWFLSRSTLQNDVIEVKQYLDKYNLQLENRPYYGMRLIGEESSIRACLTDILWQRYMAEDTLTIGRLQKHILNDIELDYLEKVLQDQIERFELKLNAEGKSYLLYSCAVSISRITQGYELIDYQIDQINSTVIGAAQEISEEFSYFLGSVLSQAELNYLCVQIMSRTIIDSPNQAKSLALVKHILSYINHTYHYNLLKDEKLFEDMSIHVSSMLSRVKYQIRTTNPLLQEIKQYYPFAYDITLSALANMEKYTESKMTEDEISYLAVHIGVALERNYSAGHERYAQILLVSDLGNATLRMIESKIKRDFPHIQISRILSYREYEQLTNIEEDFIVSTVRLTEKDKQIVKIAPFPTAYQLEQLGRLAMIDRTMPYMIERFFDKKFFLIMDKPITQSELFKVVCHRLEKQGYVDASFYHSVIEREAIVSTLLGENIAIPHSVGLLAKKTVVTTILAPQGILWDKNEVAHVIFLLAISKDEYEDAMRIYNLFVNLVKERSTKRLLNSKTFEDFQAIVKDSFGRLS
ncbi:BglG family transcription antiterminator [Gilliamella sp. B3464]|uniref:BglG family transcription antiterminator n=1 Tax=unclassified Gilliamella TaxID=2685620 RepID=UPI002269B2A1|nr:MULTISPECIES: PRD domain-containing protein [unclassified Gilliamella]MCX8712756.1 BglG family transcription antiterminator [Gilliamella sp. B3468]MCX8739394.1 BglG family transcription antiterminator [Gilliamella sp. B2824]MCX8751784.1 BglG family transcription antiterminator [Gilliamella sp. B3464]